MGMTFWNIIIRLAHKIPFTTREKEIIIKDLKKIINVAWEQAESCSETEKNASLLRVAHRMGLPTDNNNIEDAREAIHKYFESEARKHYS